MDNPPEPMPKVSIDPLPPSPDSPKPSSPPPAELVDPAIEIVVTSHEGSVVAVPAAEPTLAKAVTPPASDSQPPSPPPAPPLVVVAPDPVPPPTSPVIPPPASPVIPPTPIIQQVEPISAQVSAVQAPPSPTTTIIETTKKETPIPEVPPAPTTVVGAAKETSAPPSPDAPPTVVIEAVRQDSPPPASPVVVVTSSSSATPAPVVPLLVTQTAPIIQRSDTATYEPLRSTDRVPVLVSTRSAPEIAQPGTNEAHEIQARPSQMSTRSAPPDVIVRRDTHVVVLNPVDDTQEPRHWRDKVRKFFVTKLGGAHILRFFLGKQASNVTSAVISRY
ncbi:hypothetical protein D6D13_00791 [Aureobasidium pullulans]|uniref:Uncharacterized protein n=1 Tax=Aureobasidium pullulans TaxID=5580 RepID=A0A4S9DCT8_AURPU|nr:hypothetical protein D6D13_00791 [Aureobasidium pullulans]